MEENKNIEDGSTINEKDNIDEKLSKKVEENSAEDKMTDEELQLMREQLQKKQEKKLKRIEKNKKRDDVKRYKISAVVAGISGGLALVCGVMNKDFTMEGMGVTFICCAYFFWNMGKRAQRDKERQGR